MSEKRRPRQVITPCNQVNCLQKDCNNYSGEFRKDGFSFPDCLHNPHNPKGVRYTPVK